jgi:DNA-binding MarR family transcriptional regulator
MRELIGFQLISLMKTHRNRAAELLGELGVHPGQEMILFNLWDQDGQNQTELAGCLDVEPPTITRMVQRMETSGLVERRPDPDDGRVMRVFLSQKGVSLQDSVVKAWSRLEQMTVSGLTSGEQALLRELLFKMQSGLEKGGC